MAGPDLKDVTASSAVRATVAITAITFLSHCMGLFREASMASIYGAGLATDAYFMALIVPTILSLIFIGSLKNIMISLLGEYVYRSEKSAELRTVVWSMFHVFFIFSAAITAAIVLIMPLCMKYMAPGFTGEQLDLTIRIVRILGGIVIFNSLIVWCQSVLQIFQKFTMPAVSDLFFNTTMISGILLSASSSEL